ncbi:hypothetical protein EXE41_18380 [Halorubrum sp. SD690R]|nr:hypothetical protein EXE41_18380 [Halorubrum sp. SD690R]
MDALRDAPLLGLFRERPSPLSDLARTLEVRGESRHEHAGGDGLDEHLRELGDVVGVAVLQDRHTCDATAVARRQDHSRNSPLHR